MNPSHGTPTQTAMLNGQYAHFTNEASSVVIMTAMQSDTAEKFFY